MSDQREGNNFKGVQDRLRMFEQSKMNPNPTPPETSNSTERVMLNTIRKPPSQLQEITKQRAQMIENLNSTKSIVQNKNFENTKVQLEKSGSSLKNHQTSPNTKPPPLMQKPPEKINSINQVPIIKSPPPVQILTTKVSPSTQIQPNQENNPVLLMKITSLIKDKPTTTTKASPLTKIRPEKIPPPTPVPPVKVTQMTKIIPENIPPSTPAPPVKVHPSTKVVPEKIPPTIPALPVKAQLPNEILPSINSPTSIAIMTNITQNTENIKFSLEKISHPQPPLPPPEKLSHKTKAVINSSVTECPPPVPPPPPVIVKTQPNIVVGWAIPSNNITSENIIEKAITTNTESSIKNVESNKPPILAPPPSVASFEKTTKQQNENISNIPEETADEDEDFSNMSWYFDISKAKATQIMRDCADKGSYMVRPSDNNQYVLMIRAEADVVKKFKIQRHKSGWVLGDPSNWKRIHSSISSLMEFYCENGVKVGNSSIKLKEVVSEK